MNSIFNILDWLSMVTSDVGYNTYFITDVFFFLCNGYMFRQTIMSSSEHSIHNIYTKLLM
jgi:hypothetical protein